MERKGSVEDGMPTRKVFAITTIAKPNFEISIVDR